MSRSPNATKLRKGSVPRKSDNLTDNRQIKQRQRRNRGASAIGSKASTHGKATRPQTYESANAKPIEKVAENVGVNDGASATRAADSGYITPLPEALRNIGPFTEKATDRFPLLTAEDLSNPVGATEWLVRGVWPKGSYGPLAAASKSLKSYFLLALAVSVASGKPFLDHFPVETPGPVLLYVGEGGRDVLADRLQAIAKRADTRLEELPIYATTAIGGVSDEAFRAQLDTRIDEIKPSLVAIDPLYAYHPADVESTNLYDRGRMLAGLSNLVDGRSALIIVDHFNKSTSEILELSSIAQTGMSQWADSWILMGHTPNSPRGSGGRFALNAEIGSRQTSGGGRWVVEWSLPGNEDEYGVFVPPTKADDAREAKTLDWSVRKAEGKVSMKAGVDRTGETCQRILTAVGEAGDWELSKTQIAKRVGGRKEAVFDLLGQLVKSGELLSESRVAKGGKGGRSRTVYARNSENPDLMKSEADASDAAENDRESSSVGN